MNERVTAKERNLLKGAIRRVFSRSELRRKILDKTIIDHEDPSRPRVKKWSWCDKCNQPVPRYLMELDHEPPAVRIGEKFSDLTLDEFVDRLWCDGVGLNPICKACHKAKSKAETAQRRKKKKDQ